MASYSHLPVHHLQQQHHRHHPHQQQHQKQHVVAQQLQVMWETVAWTQRMKQSSRLQHRVQVGSQLGSKSGDSGSRMRGDRGHKQTLQLQVLTPR